jgi:tryptophan synthase alpha chain
MTYLNPLHRYGLEKVAGDLVHAGVAGLIVPDCPVDESGALTKAAAAAGLDVIALVAPTSGPERLRRIARESRGFVYLVPLTGLTGERTELPPDFVRLVRELRAVTTKPIGVGFGISTPAQVAAVTHHADAAIVGSAIVRLIESLAGDSELVPTVGAFIGALKGATRAGAAGNGSASGPGG